jgi:hypothetical protein
VRDACGAGDPLAAARALDSLAFMQTDIATFCRLIARDGA